MLLSNTATNCVRGRLSDATSNRKVLGQSWGVVIGRTSMERITIASDRCRVAQSMLLRVQAFPVPRSNTPSSRPSTIKVKNGRRKKRKTRRIFPCPFSTRQTSSPNRDKDISSYAFILAPYLEQSINQSPQLSNGKSCGSNWASTPAKYVTIFPKPIRRCRCRCIFNANANAHTRPKYAEMHTERRGNEISRPSCCHHTFLSSHADNAVFASDGNESPDPRA